LINYSLTGAGKAPDSNLNHLVGIKTLQENKERQAEGECTIKYFRRQVYSKIWYLSKIGTKWL